MTVKTIETSAENSCLEKNEVAPRSLEKSQAWLQRARKVIPGMLLDKNRYLTFMKTICRQTTSSGALGRNYFDNVLNWNTINVTWMTKPSV